MNLNFLLQLLPVLAAAVEAQESAYAIPHGISLLTAENARVGAGLTTAQIEGIITGLVQLSLAEESALIAHWTQPATASTAVAKLSSASKALVRP